VEDSLPVSVIGAMDGNQSLKRARLRDGLIDDPREFKSNYFIDEDAVNKFKHDVKSRSKRKV
jgi:hypothetical protein